MIGIALRLPRYNSIAMRCHLQGGHVDVRARDGGGVQAGRHRRQRPLAAHT